MKRLIEIEARLAQQLDPGNCSCTSIGDRCPAYQFGVDAAYLLSLVNMTIEDDCQALAFSVHTKECDYLIPDDMCVRCRVRLEIQDPELAKRNST